MNFTEALGYSFKGHNIPKILTIVLVFIIIGVSIFVSSILLESVALIFTLLPVFLGFSVFVAGYTISVIGSVMNGDDYLPAIKIGRDLGRGAVVIIASIIYSIPFFILFGVIFALLGFATPSDYGSVNAEPNTSVLLMFCGAMLAFVVIGFGFVYSLLVGQIRYAAENRAGALFNIPKNFGIVMSNIGTTLGLWIRQIGLAIVFGIFSSVIGNIIFAFAGGLFSDLAYIETADDFVQLGMPLAIFGSIYYIFVLTVNLMQSFSGAHLIAGYGIELGLAPNKLKNDETGSGTNAILIVIAVVVLLGLVACAVMTVLTLLGPAVGDVFSEIITELE